MIIFSSKAYNISALVPCVKTTITDPAVGTGSFSLALDCDWLWNIFLNSSHQTKSRNKNEKSWFYCAWISIILYLPKVKLYVTISYCLVSYLSGRSISVFGWRLQTTGCWYWICPLQDCLWIQGRWWICFEVSFKHRIHRGPEQGILGFCDSK